MKKIFLFLFLLTTATSFAQTPFVMNGTQTTISHCHLIIYDNGFVNGNYGNNRSDSLTILSNDPNNSCVQISILTLDIDPSDTLYIYNGSSSNDSLMGKLNNSNFTTEAIFNYTATIQNPTGALHLVFVTNGSGVGAGFSIVTDCESPCQRINIHLDTVLSSHVPRLDPRLNDGYYYLNVCPYDTVILQVYGEYIDNNFSYAQSDATSTFKWDLGDTVIIGVGLYVMPHKFREGRGYDVSVSIEDTAGCVTQIPLTFRVRTSSNPITGVGHLPDICTGSIVELNCSYSGIRVDSVESTQFTTLEVTDTILLPDEYYCPPYGYSYRSPVTFTSFNPTAHITNPDDILYVRLNIEHSHIGDILIQLTCPNGNTAIMLPDYQTYHWSGYTSAHFGLYYIPDGDRCNSESNPMGTGWDYCWSSTTNQGYTYANGQGFVYEPGNIGVVTRTVNPTDVANMTQVYRPYNDFGYSMNGCSLNGTWYIEVKDTWGLDNGYIFGWELALNPRFLPQAQDWTYNILIDTVIWTGNNISSMSDTSARIQRIDAGNHTYGFTIVDEYGCRYDSTFSVSVYLPDITSIVAEICRGETYSLNGFNVNTPGVYTQNLQNTHGCDSTLILTLTVNPLVGTVGDISGEQIINQPGVYSYSIEEAENATAYHWTISNEDWLLASDSTSVATLTIPVSGSGILSVYASGNCGNSNTQTLSIESNIGVIDYTPNDYISIYPNPTSGKIEIKIDNSILINGRVEIFNIYGEIIQSQLLDEISTIDLGEVANGIYFIKIKNNNITMRIYKIIKN